MGVTRAQVRRYAEAVVDYDEARNAVLNPEATRWWYHVEPVVRMDDFEAMAEAAGKDVRTRESERFVTSFFEAYGVEFIHVEEKEGGGA